MSAESQQKTRNLGVCIARILFSFLVVCNHFFSDGLGSSWIIPLRKTAVPVFFVLAFYFDERKHSSASYQETSKCTKRLLRIMIPLWFWGIVFAPFFLLEHLHKEPGIPSVLVALRGIILQEVFGHVYNIPLWFLFSLAFITTAWWMIRKLRASRKTEAAILLVACCAAFALQYSGWNAVFFSPLDSCIRFPLGRIAECIPFAIAGIALARSGIVERFRQSRPAGALLLVALLSWPFPMIPFSTPPGFGYQGLFLARSGLFLSLFFILLPLARVSSIARTGIESVAKYSLGIYCIHRPFGRLIVKALSHSSIHMNGLFGCLLVFSASWFVCFLLATFVPQSKRFIQ